MGDARRRGQLQLRRWNGAIPFQPHPRGENRWQHFRCARELAFKVMLIGSIHLDGLFWMNVYLEIVRPVQGTF